MRFAANVYARAASWVRNGPTLAAAPFPARVAAPPADIPPADEALYLAAELCRQFEGLYLRPYLCPAGVPSIGYGATRYMDGSRVQLSDPPISRARAETMLLWQLRTIYLPAVRRACPDVTDPRRVAALADFTFNLGESNLRASTLRKRVNEGRWDLVPGELKRWVRANGRILPGLVARRAAEAALI